jgi:ABC-2 type transport system ATP-binding protein
VSIREARKRAAATLEGMGFPASRMSESLEGLSRGMQQKVAIARALLTEPEILLLDEPTTGLDPVSKAQVAEYLLGLRRDHGITILLTTHDMDEADRLCDRIAILDDGRVVTLDTPSELKKKHGRNGDATLEEVFVTVTGKKWES